MASQPSEYRLVSLLASKCSENASGILTATRGKHKRLFCMDEGHLIFVASNVIEEQYIEHLVTRGILSPADRAAAKSEVADSGRNIIDIIKERNYAGEKTMRDAMGEHVGNLLDSCLGWPDGEFDFEPGSPRLDGEQTTRLPAIPIILGHVQRLPGSIDNVIMRIGPPDILLRTSPAVSTLLSEQYSNDTLLSIMEAADGETLVSALAERAPCEEKEALRTIYGMKLLGFLEDKQAKKDDSQSATKGEDLTRNEALGRLAKTAGGDHYVILGLERSAAHTEIREAYYSLARRMHPDRFRTGDLQDLLERMEKHFKRVTEAYNTLYDPDRKLEYDEFLDSAYAKEPEAKTDTTYLARQNYLRGKALVEMRKFTEALTFLENAVKMDDSKSEFHLELGCLLALNPRVKREAESHLFRAFQIDPSHWRAYFTLGTLYRRAEMYSEAGRMFREVLKWESGHQDSITQLKEMKQSPRSSGETERPSPLFGG